MTLGDLLGRIFYILPPLPRTAQLAITNRCNFNCRMCQRNDLKVKLVDMDLAVYQKILDRLAGVQNLILTSWGEPLLHPDFILMLELAKQKKFNTRFTTNGLLLSEQITQAIIDNNVEAVTFSLDQLKNHDGSLGHEVSGQLEKIILLKEMIDSSGSRTKIYLQATYHYGREQDIIEVAEFAARHHLDRLRLSRLDVRFHNFQRPGLADEKKLELKTDTYLMEDTENFFMETESHGKPGGPWRALGDGIDFFVYYYIKNNSFFWFHPKSLCKKLDKLIRSGRFKPKTIEIT